MYRRLLIVQWWHKLMLFAVPGAAFALGGYLRFYNNYFSHPTIDYYSYAALIIVTTIVWSVTAEHYDLPELPVRVESRFLAALKATFVTLCLVLLLTFFSHYPISRLFVGFGCVLMLVLTQVIRYGFLMYLRWTNLVDNYLRIGIIGVDAYASGLANKIIANSPIDSRIAVFVALPYQE